VAAMSGAARLGARWRRPVGRAPDRAPTGKPSGRQSRGRNGRR
jgi:hypothetical protein